MRRFTPQAASPAIDNSVGWRGGQACENPGKIGVSWRGSRGSHIQRNRRIAYAGLAGSHAGFSI
jgi:hypothetical protein